MSVLLVLAILNYHHFGYETKKFDFVDRHLARLRKFFFSFSRE